VWWLAIAGLPLAWIIFRTLRDVLECRLAATLWVAAIACYAAAAACYLGFVAVSGPRIETMLDASLTLVGHWLTLSAIVAYARYVVLDAQGLIPIRTRAKRAKKSESAAEKKSTKASVLSAGGYVSKKPSAAQQAESNPKTKTWIDGSKPEPENYDDDGDDDVTDGSRKLSKADRKRLRKQKMQNRAA
jgi:hypothetical protein